MSHVKQWQPFLLSSIEQQALQLAIEVKGNTFLNLLGIINYYYCKVNTSSSLPNVRKTKYCLLHNITSIKWMCFYSSCSSSGRYSNPEKNKITPLRRSTPQKPRSYNEAGLAFKACIVIFLRIPGYDSDHNLFYGICIE